MTRVFRRTGRKLLEKKIIIIRETYTGSATNKLVDLLRDLVWTLLRSWRDEAVAVPRPLENHSYQSFA